MAKEIDLKKLLQRAIELVMPNLRHYYRLPRKGKVVKSYASDGSYWADVQPLRNDDSDDADEPVISRVEIPVMWGGPERGIICPPAVGTLCDITYYDGDPNYPRISNFRWARNKAPTCELGAFVIQQAPGVLFRIAPNGGIDIATPLKIKLDAPLVEISGDIQAAGGITCLGTYGATGGGIKTPGDIETLSGKVKTAVVISSSALLLQGSTVEIKEG